MDFKDYLSIAKLIVGKPFTALTTEEANRIEKQLRLESKLSQNTENEVLLNFIEALRNHQGGLQFLEANPTISCILFRKPKKVNKSVRMQIQNYEHSQIKHFFASCLLSELLETIGSEFQTKKYIRLFELVKFHRFLPDVVVFEIIKNIYARLDYIQSKLEAKLYSATQDIHDLKSMVMYLGDEPLKSRWTKINIEATRFMLAENEINEPALYLIGNYFNIGGKTPKTAFEREKKRELRRGCNCAMIFILFLLIFAFSIVWIITPTPKPTQVKKHQPEAFKKPTWDLPTELATFQHTELTTTYDIDRPETGSDNLGSDFLSGMVPSIVANTLLVNATTSDIIIFSTSRNRSMSILKPTSRYIRAGDSLKWSAYFGTRLYIGKDPKLIVQQGGDGLTPKFRFLEMEISAKELIQKEFYFTEKLTVRDSLDSFYLENTSTLEFSDLNTNE